MNAEESFKNIWNRQLAAPLPAIGEIAIQAARVRKKMRNKILFAMLLLVATLVFLSIIVYYVKPRMVATVIGLILVCSGILLFLLVSGSLLRLLFTGTDSELTVKQQLGQLLLLKKKQSFLQRNILTLYFILLTVGILLYLPEYAGKMSVMGQIVAYGATLIWLVFNWFYIRPRTIRKQQLRISGVIDQLEQVSRQLEM